MAHARSPRAVGRDRPAGGRADDVLRHADRRRRCARAACRSTATIEAAAAALAALAHAPARAGRAADAAGRRRGRSTTGYFGARDAARARPACRSSTAVRVRGRRRGRRRPPASSATRSCVKALGHAAQVGRRRRRSSASPTPTSWPARSPTCSERLAPPRVLGRADGAARRRRRADRRRPPRPALRPGRDGRAGRHLRRGVRGRRGRPGAARPTARRERLLRSLRGAPLLAGARGRPPVDVGRGGARRRRRSRRLAAARPDIAEIEVNPLLVTPAGAVGAGRARSSPRKEARMLADGSFDGQVAIVTGGGSGMGRAMARRVRPPRARRSWSPAAGPSRWPRRSR